MWTVEEIAERLQAQDAAVAELLLHAHKVGAYKTVMQAIETRGKNLDRLAKLLFMYGFDQQLADLRAQVDCLNKKADQDDH